MTGKQLKNAILQLAIQGKLVPPACRLAGKTRPTSQLPTEETGVWYVYVIECEDGSFYKGFTTNLQKRYKEHCSGRGAEWTKKHKPKQLYYYEIQYSEEAALKREKYLKSGSGREWFKREVVDKSEDWEPASALLAQIRKEKEQLLKAGKLKPACLPAGPVCRQAGKKDLETTPITDEEKPFEIPESWEWVRLKDVFSMQAGKNINASELSQEKNGTHPYLCYGGNGVRGYIGKYNYEGIFPIVGRQGALCGCVNMATGKFQATEHAVVVTTYAQTNEFWAYYFLTASNLNQYATATAQPGLSVANILETFIPLPPLAEQHRIVAKIEELMPLVEEYGAAQEKLNRLNEALPEALKKSILQQAIQGKLVPQDANDEPASALLARIRKEKEQLVKAGKLKKKDLATTPITDEEKPFEIPESWEWVRLGEIFSHNNGKQLNRADTKGELHDYITTSNLYWDSFDLKEVRQMLFTDEELVRCTATKGDLLVCEGGDVGRSAIWDKDFDICIQNHIHRLRAYCQLCTRYFLYLLMFNKSTGLIGGKGIGIQGLSAKAVHNILVALPPLAEQRRIVARVEELMEMVEGME